MINYRLYGKLPVKDIKQAFDAVCKSAFKVLKMCEDVVFDVNIVDSKKIHAINKKYRHVDKPTDVITFANRDNSTFIIPLLGEVFICLDVAKKQAKEYKHTLQRELIFLFTHGLLHLLGFDHMNKKDEKKMFGLTDKIIKQAEINHKYIIK